MLFVEDLPRSKDFYGRLLGLLLVEEEEDFASYRLGATLLQLHPAGEPRPGVLLGRKGPGAAVQITFTVEDVGRAIDHVRGKGVEVFDEPKDRPWGTRDAGVLDPDGNEIYFSTPRKSEE